MNQEIIKIEQEQKDISEQVNSLTIVNQTTYEQGASIKITLSTFRKKLNLFFDPMVSKAKGAYDEVRGTRDKYLKPSKDLEDIVKGKLKSYERKKELEAEEAKRKAEEEHRREVDEENKKRQDEAEIFGDDKPEEVKPEEIESKQPLPTIDKVKGLGIRKVWKWKISDLSKVPKKYFMLDEIKINKEVRELKENTNIPGIEAYCE